MKNKMVKIFVSVFAIVTLCFLFAGCERGGDTSRYAIEAIEFETSLDVVKMTEEISEEYPVRTSGSVSEKQPGGGEYEETISVASASTIANDRIFLDEYIGKKMGEMGYSGKIEEFEFNDVYDQSRLKKGYNGVWTRVAESESKGTIWIVAAYDNSAGIPVSDIDLSTGQVSSVLLGGEGAYGSATSVATALAIADRLKGAETQYDIVFAFVGCSQFSNNGIRELLADHDAPDLVVNLNRLGGGTYNYIYSAEVETDFNDAFYAAANSVGGDTFRPVPGNTHAVAATMIENQPNDYTHIGMYGDNLFTMSRGIPTVSFLSLDWSSDTNSFYTEIDGMENVYNTSGDTYANMISRIGDDGEKILGTRLNAVADTVAVMLSPDNAAILDEVLSTAPEQASVAAQQSHAEAGVYTRLAIVLAAVIAAVVLMSVGRNKLAKVTIKKAEETKPFDPREDVFEGFSDGGSRDDGDSNDNSVNPPEDPFEY